MNGLGLSVAKGSFSNNFTGLLQANPNSVAAYSLRRLSNTYSGFAVTVRKASGGDPVNIGFTAGGDLDVQTLTTECAGTDAFVTTWYDQSGNGRNFTQTSASAQPKIVSSGSIITMTGKTEPCVEFNTDGMFMDLSTAFTFTDEFLMHFVIEPLNNTNSFGVLLNASGSTSNRIRILANGSSHIRINGTAFEEASAFNGDPIVYVVERNSSDEIKQYINDALDSTDTDSNDFPVLFRLGINQAEASTHSLKAKISEMVFYNTDASSRRTAITDDAVDYFIT
jgi:hypothetical protein